MEGEESFEEVKEGLASLSSSGERKRFARGTSVVRINLACFGR